MEQMKRLKPTRVIDELHPKCLHEVKGGNWRGISVCLTQLSLFIDMVTVRFRSNFI